MNTLSLTVLFDMPYKVLIKLTQRLTSADCEPLLKDTRVCTDVSRRR
jgi:hypothetical protein